MYTGNGYSTIDFWEEGLRVKNLINSIELKDSYQFRHKIFVDELGWVAPQENGIDIDAYDGEGMLPLGIFDQNEKLIAHLRITLPHRTFMMEREFENLIEIPIQKTQRTVEVSRTCIEESIRKNKVATFHGSFHISMLLYKGLYQWCCQNFINDMYMVIEYKMLRLLKMSGFPCEKIGKTTVMPNGVSAVAVRVDWSEFEPVNKNSKPQLLAWFGDTGDMRRRVAV